MYCHILHVRAIPTLESTDSMMKLLSADKTCKNVEIQLCALCYEEDDSELVGEVEWVQCSNCNVWMHVSYVQNTLDICQIIFVTFAYKCRNIPYILYSKLNAY